jgi:hypothetical protein
MVFTYEIRNRLRAASRWIGRRLSDCITSNRWTARDAFRHIELVHYLGVRGRVGIDTY